MSFCTATRRAEKEDGGHRPPLQHQPDALRHSCPLKILHGFLVLFATARVLNVPRFLRFPVFGLFFREYNRYPPDFSFLIMMAQTNPRPFAF
jgi:hypothetical protein